MTAPPQPNLLIVEDSDEDFALIDWALQRAGFQGSIRRCTRVAEALAALWVGEEEETAPADGHPDAVLLDLNLPDGTGLEVLETIRTRPGYLRAPIVIVTSSSHPREMDACARLGAAGYLIKPLDRATFLARLQAFVQTGFQAARVAC